MAVATISLFDFVTDSSDVAVPNAKVRLTFGYNAATTADGLLQPSVQEVVTDSTGKFTFSKVIPNDLISPANTVYLIETPFRSYLVAPQSGNGPSQQSTAANVIVNNPLALAPYTGLTSLTVSGNLTVTGNEALTGNETVGGTLGVTGLVTASGGEVISGGTGATLNASGDLAVRSITASSGSGPYTPTSAAGTINNEYWLPAPTGVAATDSANMAAVLAAIPAQGATIKAQRGTYIFNQQFIWLAGLYIIGAGIGASIFQLANNANLGANTPWFLVPSGTVNWGLASLTLDGNRANQTSGGAMFQVNNATLVMTTDGRITDVNFLRAFNFAGNIAGRRIWITRVHVEDAGINGPSFQISFGVRNPADTTTGNQTREIYIDKFTSTDHTSQVKGIGLAIFGPGKTAWGTLIKGVFVSNFEGRNLGTGLGSAGINVAANQLQSGEILPYTNMAGLQEIHIDGFVVAGSADNAAWFMGVTGFSLDGIHIDQSGFAGGGVEVQGAADGAIGVGDIRNTTNSGLIIHVDDGSANNFSLSTSNITVGALVLDTCGGGAANADACFVQATTAGHLCTGIVFIGTIIVNSPAIALDLLGLTDVTLNGIIVEDSGTANVAGRTYGIIIQGTAGLPATSGIRLLNCRSGNKNNNKQTHGLIDNSNNLAAQGIQVVGGDFTNNATATIAPQAGKYIIRGAIGYNPFGQVVQGVAATGVAMGPFNVDIYGYLNGGASTCAITIDTLNVITVAAGDTMAFFVPAGKTWTYTYTGAPGHTLYGA